MDVIESDIKHVLSLRHDDGRKRPCTCRTCRAITRVVAAARRAGPPTRRREKATDQPDDEWHVPPLPSNPAGIGYPGR